MPKLRTYHVFISHAWEHHDDYDRLVDMLDQAPNFSWKNYSVPEHDPLDADNQTELEEELREQIRPVHIVIVLSGMYAAYREWIQKEIDLAQEMGKPIIGVKPWGQERIPEVVQQAAEEIVGWNTDSIVRAIRQHALELEGHHGKTSA